MIYGVIIGTSLSSIKTIYKLLIFVCILGYNKVILIAKIFNKISLLSNVKQKNKKIIKNL